MVYSQCAICKNYVLNKKCWAFPDGIPDKVFRNDIVHDHVIDGQFDKYLFESINDKK